MLHLEWLVLVGYIDSLFAERTVRKDQPIGTVPDTLGQLYLQAMRHHAREAALLSREGDRWVPLPDWRLDRHVIRIALYLQERLGVKPGDRIAVVAEPSVQWLIADLAAVATGAVSVAVDPGLPSQRLLGALVDAGPRVIFASPTALAPLDGGSLSLPGLSQVITLGGARADGLLTWAQALELGGTLDTAERAQALRAAIRGLPSDHPALCHLDPAVEGRVAWEELTHGGVAERIAELWRLRPAQGGDRVYLATPVVTLGVRLALHACLGDGYSMVVLQSPGRDAADLAEVGPHRVIAEPRVLGGAVERARAIGPAPEPDGGWRERAKQLLAPRSRESAEQRNLRAAFGGRVRAVDSTGPLDPALARQLQGIAAVGSAMD
jgi:long-chain acyl-CoA synthetase